MRNNLPPCILHSCRFYSDGNCTNKAAYENCEQRCLNERFEESQRDESGWVSTRDRFPEDENERVLAYSPEMGRDARIQIVSGWSLIHDAKRVKAFSHWMPLPPIPPEEA